MLPPAQPREPSVEDGGTSQFELRSNRSPASSTSRAPLSRDLGVGESIPWSNTDRIAAQVQALLSNAAQDRSAVPQTTGANSTSRAGASSNRKLPTSRSTAFSNVRSTIPPSIPSISGGTGSPPPIQPPTQVCSPRHSPSTTAILHRDTTQAATGQWASRQASSGTHGLPPPRPVSPGLPTSAQSPSAPSDSASSEGWAPELQLAIESSSQLQTALGLVDVAAYAPPPTSHHNSYNATANNYAGNHTTAASIQHGQPAQQNGNHAMAGQNGQQSRGSVDPRPWFF